MSLFERLRSSRRALVTLGVLGGSFLAAMEATIVATAMPTVVGQFGGLAHYSWVFSGYMLTSTVTTPVWGRLADVYGRRRPYLVALGLFVLGSTAVWRRLVHDAAHRVPHAAGRRCRRHAPDRDGHHRRHVHARGAGPSAGPVRGRVGDLLYRRAPGGRGAHRERVMAVDLLHQPAVRPRAGVAGRAVPDRHARRGARATWTTSVPGSS